MTWQIAKRVYEEHLVRTTSDKWPRGVCSAPENQEHMVMFNRGMEWADENKEFMNPVSISNEGLLLQGEFYNFGFDRTVIILQGRAEALTYSYYYAIPYKNLNLNVLVIDGRAHGLSQGKCNSVGLVEYRDVIAWAQMLNKKWNQQTIILHGICIGSATALYAITDQECPECVKGIITDGMYTSFYETFKNHMKEMKKPLFPVIFEIMIMIHKASGKSPIFFGPKRSIRKLTKPILMLQGRQDIYSLPRKAEKMYCSCKAPKYLAYFDKGAHSHLRINAPTIYDDTIKEFVNAI